MKKMLKFKCINPTNTLTAGKIYYGEITYELAGWGRYEFIRVVNDNGVSTRYSTNRFNQIK